VSLLSLAAQVVLLTTYGAGGGVAGGDGHERCDNVGGFVSDRGFDFHPKPTGERRNFMISIFSFDSCALRYLRNYP
jgi:hypothetical protein